MKLSPMIGTKGSSFKGSSPPFALTSVRGAASLAAHESSQSGFQLGSENESVCRVGGASAPGPGDDGSDAGGSDAGGSDAGAFDWASPVLAAARPTRSIANATVIFTLFPSSRNGAPRLPKDSLAGIIARIPGAASEVSSRFYT